MYQMIPEKAVPIYADSFHQYMERIQIVINRFGYWQQGEVDSLSGFIMTDHELTFLIKGESHVKKGDLSICAQAGGALLFEPFTPYNVACVSKEKCEYFYIHFDIEPEYMAGIFKRTVFGESMYFPDIANYMAGMLEEIYYDRDKGLPGLYTKAEAVLKLYLVKIMREYGGKGDAAVLYCSREFEVIGEFIKHIGQNIDKPVRMAEIAHKLGVSESYLYKTFVSIMKIPPSRYAIQYKIKKAEEMLKTGYLSITQIAYDLGFSSMFHFSKTFKAYMGVSPSEYKLNR